MKPPAEFVRDCEGHAFEEDIAERDAEHQAKLDSHITYHNEQLAEAHRQLQEEAVKKLGLRSALRDIFHLATAAVDATPINDAPRAQQEAARDLNAIRRMAKEALGWL